MGLFDSLQFEYTLPLPTDLQELSPADFQNQEYQTKDFYKALELYKVDINGQLFLQVNKYDVTPGDPSGASICDRLPQSNLVSSDWEISNKTDTINCYNWIQRDNLKNDYWIEYEVIFVSGKIESVKLIEFRAEDNRERKKHWENFADKLAAEVKFLNKWYVKYTYGFYSKIMKFIFKYLTKFLNYIHSNLWSIERFFIPL